MSESFVERYKARALTREVTSAGLLYPLALADEGAEAHLELSFALKIVGVDFLEFALQLEEESRLVHHEHFALFGCRRWDELQLLREI